MRWYDKILYAGEKFTVEWYYGENGKSQPFAYFEKLSPSEQQKLLYLAKRIGDYGKISDKTKFNFEGDGFFAFKPKPNRFLSFFAVEGKIVITNAFAKKAQKLPRGEKELALKCRVDYEFRVQRGMYYDNVCQAYAGRKI